jgi:hypothetical protein
MSMPQPSHTTARITWTNASTKSVDVSGTKFVYRELGTDNGVPVIVLSAHSFEQVVRRAKVAIRPGPARKFDTPRNMLSL